MTPAVRFFIPAREWPENLPSTPADFWPWALGSEDRKYTYGRYVVTVRTYLELREAGFPCELTDTLAPDSILVTHVDFLPHTGDEEAQDRRVVFDRHVDETFIVSFQGDRPRHPYVRLRLVQNRADAVGMGVSPVLSRIRPRLHYMPYWTQPGLLARESERGEAFVNVAFLGHPGESDPSLSDPAWIDHMTRLGFRFHVRKIPDWHDYRDVDAVLAARAFDYKGQWLWKPPTKLFNAWLAGVPAVLGRESAYTAERESELDYVEVDSRDEVEAALVRLRENAELRTRMVEHGLRRAAGVSAEGLTARWRRFLETEAYPAYERWRRSSRSVRRRLRWQDTARIRAEAAVRTALIVAQGSRELYRHRNDWY